MRVGGEQAPATLPPEKIRYPLYRRLGGPQSPKTSPPTGFRSPDRSGRSEMLYRLRSPGPLIQFIIVVKLFSKSHTINVNLKEEDWKSI